MLDCRSGALARQYGATICHGHCGLSLQTLMLVQTCYSNKDKVYNHGQAIIDTIVVTIIPTIMTMDLDLARIFTTMVIGFNTNIANFAVAQSLMMGMC